MLNLQEFEVIKKEENELYQSLYDYIVEITD